MSAVAEALASPSSDRVQQARATTAPAARGAARGGSGRRSSSAVSVETGGRGRDRSLVAEDKGSSAVQLDLVLYRPCAGDAELRFLDDGPM
jgi:hypothetical protein